MSKPMRLEDLKDMDLDDEMLEDYSDKSSFSNYSKSIAIKIAYLLGVRQDFLFTIDESAEDIFNELTGNMDATIIRALNNLRSNIILNFKRISRTIRISANDYQPIYKIDILENDFKTLKKYNIEITTGRQDLNEYLERISPKSIKAIKIIILIRDIFIGASLWNTEIYYYLMLNYLILYIRMQEDIFKI